MNIVEVFLANHYITPRTSLTLAMHFVAPLKRSSLYLPRSITPYKILCPFYVSAFVDVNYKWQYILEKEVTTKCFYIIISSIFIICFLFWSLLEQQQQIRNNKKDLVFYFLCFCVVFCFFYLKDFI